MYGYGQDTVAFSEDDKEKKPVQLPSNIFHFTYLQV